MGKDHAWLGLSRPATRFCNTRRWLGLLQPSPHPPSSAAGTGDSRSRSRPPVHAACATRDTSPVIGSVTDVCVVTLLRVVVVVVIVEVTVALCPSEGGSTAGTVTARWGCCRWCRPVADRAGDTSPGLGRMRRRSVEETELECASDLRLPTVNPRECSEAEFETGAEPAALSAECGLRRDRIECSDPCSEVVASRG